MTAARPKCESTVLASAFTMAKRTGALPCCVEYLLTWARFFCFTRVDLLLLLVRYVRACACACDTAGPCGHSSHRDRLSPEVNIIFEIIYKVQLELGQRSLCPTTQLPC